MKNTSTTKLPNNLQGIAIPWFTQDEWLLARDYMQDAATFQASYDEFALRVQQFEIQERARGGAIIRINVKKEEITAWAVSRGGKINAKERSIYAAMCAAKQDRDSAHR